MKVQIFKSKQRAFQSYFKSGYCLLQIGCFVFWFYRKKHVQRRKRFEEGTEEEMINEHNVGGVRNEEAKV